MREVSSRFPTLRALPLEPVSKANIENLRNALAK